ncbi:MAG: hypothetical protein IT422_29875 [Pirellulaceae bacterium]|nr:hypothetical protein [Pirellulaceae bacterium]
MIAYTSLCAHVLHPRLNVVAGYAFFVLLLYIGFCSAIKHHQRVALRDTLETET